MLFVLVLVVLLVLWLVRRTAWRTSRPIPVRAERGFGEVVAVSWPPCPGRRVLAAVSWPPCPGRRVLAAVSWPLFRSRWRLFLGIGSVVALVSLATGLLTQLASGSLTGSAAEVEGDPSVALALATALSTPPPAHLTGPGAGGDGAGPRRDRRGRARHRGGRLPAGARTRQTPVRLTALLALVGIAALRRSWRLVRPQLVKVAGLLAFGGLLTALVGGLVGVLPLLVAQVPFLVVNLIPGVVAALLGPFTSLLLAYAYFHGVAAQTQPEETAAISAS